MHDESPSFFNPRSDEDGTPGIDSTNNRISEMIFRQERVHFDSNFDESRPSEMPSMQLQNLSQSLLPGVD